MSSGTHGKFSAARVVIGATFLVLVWALYIVRVAFGVGPMHDEGGRQAPTVHYLVGALVVSVMVGGWLVSRARAAD
jgi:hypothetical protein